MTDTQLKEKVNGALDDAESIWKQVAPQLRTYSKGGIFEKAMEASIPSNIPGHPFVNPLTPEVDDFIAFVLDIRKSSEHLTQHYAAGKATQLKRVLYEITAVNTIGSIITDEKGGKITEFLGDGFLALYKCSDNNKGNVYRAHDAANDCIRVVKDVVNPILYERYNLPALHIGIGLAYSKAIITVMGYGNNLHPKALGECVFRATKMSDGYDEIRIDDRLEVLWPKAQGGRLRFNLHQSKHGFKEYTIDYERS